MDTQMVEIGLQLTRAITVPALLLAGIVYICNKIRRGRDAH